MKKIGSLQKMMVLFVIFAKKIKNKKYLVVLKDFLDV